MAVAIQRIQDDCTSEKGRLEKLRNNALSHSILNDYINFSNRLVKGTRKC